MDDFYAARSRIIPPLTWPTFSPPFSLMVGHSESMVVEHREMFQIRPSIFRKM
ncbi:hypothetical protein [Donghicola tyrosinivorans]|uniref:hypothetical protein n=1 Tax=Donghicola tyrosinivorans TaxID=1652492 RepID=UPI001475BB67|nr:hypothetical protein [Donghicola tyrosinivorans]